MPCTQMQNIWDINQCEQRYQKISTNQQTWALFLPLYIERLHFAPAALFPSSGATHPRTQITSPQCHSWICLGSNLFFVLKKMRTTREMRKRRTCCESLGTWGSYAFQAHCLSLIQKNNLHLLFLYIILLVYILNIVGSRELSTLIWDMWRGMKMYCWEKKSHHHEERFKAHTITNPQPRRRRYDRSSRGDTSVG